MSDDDPYPDPVKRAAEYAREELSMGFAPSPADFYEPTGNWESATYGSKKTYTGLGVHVGRDEYSDTPGDDQWKVEVRMTSHPSAEPLLLEDCLSVDEMQNLIRAFQYQLKWFYEQEEYEPSYPLD